MFDKLKTAMSMSRLMRVCGCDIDNLSRADKIVTRVILFPMKNRKKPPFNNKYVLADAALLGMLYGIINSEKYYINKSDVYMDYPKYVKGMNSYDSFTSETIKKTYLGILKMYKVEKDSFINNASNRLKYFEPILRAKDMNAFYNGAENLFIQDITNKRFVPMSDDEPIQLYDVNQFIDIEIETTAYFTALFNMLDNM